MSNLAQAYQAAGKRDLALPFLEETLKLTKSKLGPDHPDSLTTMQNLANAYEAAGKWDLALPLYEEALKLHKAKLGPEHPYTVGVMATFALGLLSHKDFARAEPLLRDCLAIREKTQPDAWTTFNTRSMLGGALLGQKKYAEAEPLLLKGYEGMKQREKSIPPRANTRIPEALDRLIELYTAMNRPDAVKRWWAERAKYPDIKPADKK